MPKVGEPGCRYGKSSASKRTSLKLSHSNCPVVRHA